MRAHEVKLKFHELGFSMSFLQQKGFIGFLVEMM